MLLALSENNNLLGCFFAKNESIKPFSFRSSSCKFWNLPAFQNEKKKKKNAPLMTVSMETVRMAKSRPRKNQSELSDLTLDYLEILEVHYFYHLSRKHLRRIFLEKHFLKYFNCLHDV